MQFQLQNVPLTETNNFSKFKVLKKIIFKSDSFNVDT